VIENAREEAEKDDRDSKLLFIFSSQISCNLYMIFKTSINESQADKHLVKLLLKHITSYPIKKSCFSITFFFRRRRTFRGKRAKGWSS